MEPKQLLPELATAKFTAELGLPTANVPAERSEHTHYMRGRRLLQ